MVFCLLLAVCILTSLNNVEASIVVVSEAATGNANIRLCNGTTSKDGRVEYLHNNKWMSVCDKTWGLEEARKVCRDLEFGEAAVPVKKFGGGKGKMLLFDCSGRESNLTNCTKTVIKDLCNHSDDAGVICKNNDDLDPCDCESNEDCYHSSNGYNCRCREGYEHNCQVSCPMGSLVAAATLFILSVLLLVAAVVVVGVTIVCMKRIKQRRSQNTLPANFHQLGQHEELQVGGPPLVRVPYDDQTYNHHEKSLASSVDSEREYATVAVGGSAQYSTLKFPHHPKKPSHDRYQMLSLPDDDDNDNGGYTILRGY